MIYFPVLFFSHKKGTHERGEAIKISSEKELPRLNIVDFSGKFSRHFFSIFYLYLKFGMQHPRYQDGIWDVRVCMFRQTICERTTKKIALPILRRTSNPHAIQEHLSSHSIPTENVVKLFRYIQYRS